MQNLRRARLLRWSGSLRAALGPVLAFSVFATSQQAPAEVLAQPINQLERIPAGADRPSGQPYRAASPSVSGDGRFVVFWSQTADLVPGDTNNLSDVFLKDRLTGAIERVSLAADGTQANGSSLNAVISPDGRFIAFESRATNLVPGDLNSSIDVFLKDRETGALERVSLSSDATQGNGGSYRPALTPDGRYVAFWSEASNLVPDDINGTYDNGGYDVFVKDRMTGTLERLSVAADGAEGVADSVTPAISADGRFVVFGSYSPNLIAGDTNELPDIFLKDRETGAVERISVAADGAEADGGSFWNPVISADGRFVAFWSEASNLVPDDTNGVMDVLVKDRQTGLVERVSAAADGAQGDGPSYNPVLSADGMAVVFWSEASNLSPDDGNGVADVFLKDRSTGTLQRVSLATDGASANGPSMNPSLSVDGQLLVFWSDAGNLVAGDENGKSDVFLVERGMP